MFLLLVQSVANTVAAQIGVWLSPRTPSTLRFKHVFPVSVSYIFAMYTSNLALLYLNYPTQILAKSCKMVPVMLGGAIFLRTRYHLINYLAVGSITAGIAVFQLFKATMSESVSTTLGWGELLVIVSLVLDGVTGSLQDGLRKDHKFGTHHMMFLVNAGALAVVAVLVVANGELAPAMDLCLRSPKLLLDLVMFGLASALGQNFVFFSVKQFGALALAGITTTRKFFSILFSVLWFGHVITTTQWLGVVLVFAGLGLEMFARTSSSHKVPPAASSGKPHAQ
jgi:UDP-galactose transporter B1